MFISVYVLALPQLLLGDMSIKTSHPNTYNSPGYVLSFPLLLLGGRFTITSRPNTYISSGYVLALPLSCCWKAGPPRPATQTHTSPQDMCYCCWKAGPPRPAAQKHIHLLQFSIWTWPTPRAAHLFSLNKTFIDIYNQP